MNRLTQDDVDSVTVIAQTDGVPHQSLSAGDVCTLESVEEELVNESESRFVYELTTGDVSFSISHVGLAQALQNEEVAISR